jgi:hypothetical protein
MPLFPAGANLPSFLPSRSEDEIDSCDDTWEKGEMDETAADEDGEGAGLGLPAGGMMMARRTAPGLDGCVPISDDPVASGI